LLEEDAVLHRHLWLEPGYFGKAPADRIGSPRRPRLDAVEDESSGPRRSATMITIAKPHPAARGAHEFSLPRLSLFIFIFVSTVL
jgi:hypothetical protein